MYPLIMKSIHHGKIIENNQPDFFFPVCQKAQVRLKLQVVPSLQRLMIYRWAQQALATPADHPLLPLVWQKFFQLYLRQPGPEFGCVKQKHSVFIWLVIVIFSIWFLLHIHKIYKLFRYIIMLFQFTKMQLLHNACWIQSTCCTFCIQVKMFTLFLYPSFFFSLPLISRFVLLSY